MAKYRDAGKDVGAIVGTPTRLESAAMGAF